MLTAWLEEVSLSGQRAAQQPHHPSQRKGPVCREPAIAWETVAGCRRVSLLATVLWMVVENVPIPNSLRFLTFHLSQVLQPRSYITLARMV